MENAAPFDAAILASLSVTSVLSVVTKKVRLTLLRSPARRQNSWQAREVAASIGPLLALRASIHILLIGVRNLTSATGGSQSLDPSHPLVCTPM